MPTKSLSRTLVADGLLVVDLLVLLVSSIIAFEIYVNDILDANYLFGTYMIVTLVATVGFGIVAVALNSYEPAELTDPYHGMCRVLLAFAAVCIAGLALGFVTRSSGDWSRGWAIMTVSLTVSGLFLDRALLNQAIQRWQRRGSWNDRVVVLGTPELALRLLDEFDKNSRHVDMVAVFDERRTKRSSPSLPVPLIHGLDALFEFVRGNPIDQIIIAHDWRDEERILKLVDRLSVLPVDVDLAFSTRLIHKFCTKLVSAHGAPLMKMGSRPLSDREVLVKRIEDLVLGGVITLLVSPILLIVALAVWCESKGPVLFTQDRHGFNDTVFRIYKFRTMYVDRADPAGLQRSVRGDPRVTRIGRFLRRWSLDELPQLFNVLKGDMSLIGPRPHPVGMRAADDDYREVVVDYASRHRVKPGITGWAQVKGYRGALETVESARLRFEHDLEYIDRWSLLFDCRILVMTALAVVVGTEAY